MPVQRAPSPLTCCRDSFHCQICGHTWPRPLAPSMRLKVGEVYLGYHTTYVVDGGKRRIILNVLVTSSEVMENQPILDLLWLVQFRWRLKPHQATGDTTYGTLENIKLLEDARIRAYIPLPDWSKRTPFFGPEQFTYDAQHNQYICLTGTRLRLKTHRFTYQDKRYRGDPAICNTCPLKKRCTASSQGRQITRHFDEQYLDRVRAYHQTEAYQKAMRKRKVWVKPLFAEAKDWHGLRRFRLRRLWRVNCEALLIAAGQNLQRLLQKRGWGKRPQPSGAAIHLMKACWMLGIWSIQAMLTVVQDHPLPRTSQRDNRLSVIARGLFQQPQEIFGSTVCPQRTNFR